MNIIERGISVLCQVLLWISTVVIFLILVINTVLRYVSGASLQWANEVPELLFPWLVMAGVVLAAMHSAHIATTFMMARLNGLTRRVVGTLGWLVVCVLYSTLTVATYRMLEIVHDEKSPILQIPGSMTYGCVMVGMALLALLAMLSAGRTWTSKGDDNHADAVPVAHW